MLLRVSASALSLSESTLEGASLPFDASLGRSGVGGDDLNTQVLKDAADMGGVSDAGKLFLMAPVIIVAHKGAMAVLIDGGGDAVASQDHIQQSKVADGVFLGSEEGSQDGSRRVVDGVVEAAREALVAEPGMRAAVPLHHQPHLRATETPTPVLRRSSSPFRFDSRLPQPLANRFPADL